VDRSRKLYSRDRAQLFNQRVRISEHGENPRQVPQPTWLAAAGRREGGGIHEQLFLSEDWFEIVKKY
jgi:hypothetical protein